MELLILHCLHIAWFKVQWVQYNHATGTYSVNLISLYEQLPEAVKLHQKYDLENWMTKGRMNSLLTALLTFNMVVKSSKQD